MSALMLAVYEGHEAAALSLLESEDVKLDLQNKVHQLKPQTQCLLSQPKQSNPALVFMNYNPTFVVHTERQDGAYVGEP